MRPRWRTPRSSYDVSVRVDAAARRLEGHARIVVPNDSGAPLGELWLWRFPERFAARSPALNDYNFYWVYPYRFDPGHMRTGAVVVDGRAASVEVRDHPRAGRARCSTSRSSRRFRPAPRPPSRSTSASRCRGATVRSAACTATARSPGSIPMVAPPAAGLDAMPGRGSYHLSIAVHDVSDVVVNGALAALERGRRLDFDVGHAEGLTLMVGRPRLRQFERVVRGVRIVYLSPTGRGLRSPPEHVLPYQPANRVDRTLDAAADAVELLGELGAPLPAGAEVRIVAGPLRIQLAQALPGVVLVSDQLFDIFPLPRFLKFHEFELARAVYESWVAQRTLDAERADDLGWAPGAAASYLVDLYTLRSYRKAEFAREILAWASFIPAIDRVMYAPQVPFASSYFYTLEDPDPLRDNLQQFNNSRPTGKTVYSKLRDLLGTPAVDLLTRAQLGGVALRAAGGDACAATRSTGSGRSGSVPIRRSTIASPTCARSASASTPIATVARVVKIGEHPPVEPVEVRATDKKGNVVTQTWDGVGREHTYVFDDAGGAVGGRDRSARPSRRGAAGQATTT